MSESRSTSPVRRESAPLVPVDYRFDMTRRSMTGLAAAGLVVAFLIFLTGLVLGVNLNLAVPDESLSIASNEGAEAASGEEVPVDAEPVVLDPPAMVEDDAGQAARNPMDAPSIEDPWVGVAEDAGRVPAREGAYVSAPAPRSVAGEERGSEGSESAVESPPARELPTVALPAGEVRGEFVLQAGAFRSVENAENLRARLGGRGYSARVRTTPGSSGQPLYRVMIGEYPTESQAVAAADRFRSDTGQEAYVMSAREMGS